jgi:hypothetical protein
MKIIRKSKKRFGAFANEKTYSNVIIRMLKNNLILMKDLRDKSFVFLSNENFDEKQYDYYDHKKNFHYKNYRMYYKYRTNWIYPEGKGYLCLEKLFYENNN